MEKQNKMNYKDNDKHIKIIIKYIILVSTLFLLVDINVVEVFQDLSRKIFNINIIEIFSSHILYYIMIILYTYMILEF